MRVLALVVCFAACVAVATAAGPPAPFWVSIGECKVQLTIVRFQANHFSVNISQMIKLNGVHTYTNSFSFYYDSVNNVSREDRGKGQFDEACRCVGCAL